MSSGVGGDRWGPWCPFLVRARGPSWSPSAVSVSDSQKECSDLEPSASLNPQAVSRRVSLSVCQLALARESRLRCQEEDGEEKRPAGSLGCGGREAEMEITFLYLTNFCPAISLLLEIKIYTR